MDMPQNAYVQFSLHPCTTPQRDKGLQIIRH